MRSLKTLFIHICMLTRAYKWGKYECSRKLNAFRLKNMNFSKNAIFVFEWESFIFYEEYVLKTVKNRLEIYREWKKVKYMYKILRL